MTLTNDLLLRNMYMTTVKLPTLNSLKMVESQSQDDLHFWTTHFGKLAALVIVLHSLPPKGLNNCCSRFSSQPVLPQCTPYRCFYDRHLNTRHAQTKHIKLYILSTSTRTRRGNDISIIKEQRGHTRTRRTHIHIRCITNKNTIDNLRLLKNVHFDNITLFDIIYFT